MFPSSSKYMRKWRVLIVILCNFFYHGNETRPKISNQFLSRWELQRVNCRVLVFFRQWGLVVALCCIMLCCDWLVFKSCHWHISMMDSLIGPLPCRWVAAFFLDQEDPCFWSCHISLVNPACEKLWWPRSLNVKSLQSVQRPVLYTCCCLRFSESDVSVMPLDSYLYRSFSS